MIPAQAEPGLFHKWVIYMRRRLRICRIFIAWSVLAATIILAAIFLSGNIAVVAFGSSSGNISAGCRDGDNVLTGMAGRFILKALAAEARTVVIDPGHQLRGDSSKESVAPGSSETKARVTGGTTGVYTGIPEYQLNLDVSLLLQAELQSRGYNVIMCRTSNDVNISNSERAMIANNAAADAFVRIHANGSEDPGVNGIMTICQTASNPYNGALFDRSYSLSSMILEHAAAATGAVKQGVWQTDTMSGINWAQVPVTIVEMGYMSNKDEDIRMSDPAYRKLMAWGIANGIDAYFGTEISTAPMPEQNVPVRAAGDGFLKKKANIRLKRDVLAEIA